MLCATIVSASISSSAIVHNERTWSSVGVSPCNQKAPPQSSAEYSAWR